MYRKQTKIQKTWLHPNALWPVDPFYPFWILNYPLSYLYNSSLSFPKSCLANRIPQNNTIAHIIASWRAGKSIGNNLWEPDQRQVYQKIVCRAAPHKLRPLVSDSGATPCPAQLPQGQRDHCQPTRPFAVILWRISALKKALSKKENINVNKATQTWVWKPVLPLIIYAIFSRLLNFSEPQV